MTKEETIEALCSLVTEVGAEVFENNSCHDCFCKLQRFKDSDVCIDSEVVEFIVNATRKAITNSISSRKP